MKILHSIFTISLIVLILMGKTIIFLKIKNIHCLHFSDTHYNQKNANWIFVCIIRMSFYREKFNEFIEIRPIIIKKSLKKISSINIWNLSSTKQGITANFPPNYARAMQYDPQTRVLDTMRFHIKKRDFFASYQSIYFLFIWGRSVRNVGL